MKKQIVLIVLPMKTDLIFALLLTGLLFACKEKEDTPLQPFVPEPELKDGVYVASWSSFYEDSTNSDRSISTRWFDLGQTPPFDICLKRKDSVFVMGRLENDSCIYCNECRIRIKLEGMQYKYQLSNFLLNSLEKSYFAFSPLFVEQTAGFSENTDSCSCFDYVISSKYSNLDYLYFTGYDTLAVLYFNSTYVWHPVADTGVTLSKPFVNTAPNSSTFFLGYKRVLPH